MSNHSPLTPVDPGGPRCTALVTLLRCDPGGVVPPRRGNRTPHSPGRPPRSRHLPAPLTRTEKQPTPVPPNSDPGRTTAWLTCPPPRIKARRHRKSDQDHGLQGLAPPFRQQRPGYDREETIYIVARVSLREVREHLDRDDDPFEFVLGVDAIEAVGDEHADTVSDLIERLYDARTRQPLPFPKSVA
jgi:hypothetical protein